MATKESKREGMVSGKAVRIISKAETRFQEIFNSGPDIALVIEPASGRVMEANEKALETYGYSSKEILKHTIWDLTDSAGGVNIAERLQQAVNTGSPTQFTHRRKNRKAFPVELTAQETSLNGQPMIVTHLRDISGRQSSSEATPWAATANLAIADFSLAYLSAKTTTAKKAATIFLEQVLPLTGSQIGCVAHLEGENPVLACSAAVVRMGSDETDPTEATILDRFRVLFDRALTEQNPVLWQAGGEQTGPVKTDRLAQAMAVPVWVEGKIDGVIGLAEAPQAYTQDDLKTLTRLTGFYAVALQHCRAEETRKIMEEQVDRSQRMESLGKLVSGIAHDFNNVLTAIQGGADLLMMDAEDNPKIRQNVEEIGRAVHRASTLIHQLLLFSRQQPVQMSPLDLNQVIAELVKMLKRIVRQDVQILIDPGPGLYCVQADRTNIEQLIMNLVINSQDAMPEGGQITLRTENYTFGPEISRHIPGAHPGQFVCLSVSDTGAGIPPALLPKIFEPFFTTKTKGTGLGLSVVYGIVSKHGGWVHVDSNMGKGTNFQIYLPASMEGKVWRVSPVEKGEPVHGRGNRVLIIEDEGGVRAMAASILTKSGFTIFEATNAAEAIKIFREERGAFDLIFCDIVLPDQRGPALVEQLLAIRPETQVLFTSGYSSEESEKAILKEQGFPFLPKPYTMEALLQTVQSSIKRGANRSSRG